MKLSVVVITKDEQAGIRRCRSRVRTRIESADGHEQTRSRRKSTIHRSSFTEFCNDISNDDGGKPCGKDGGCQIRTHAIGRAN